MTGWGRFVSSVWQTRRDVPVRHALDASIEWRKVDVNERGRSVGSDSQNDRLMWQEFQFVMLLHAPPIKDHGSFGPGRSLRLPVTHGIPNGGGCRLSEKDVQGVFGLTRPERR